MLLDSVAVDFPDMQIVIAHPSWPWQDEALSVCLHKPNVWIDLSGWSPKYFPPQLVQYANTLLKDRMLFGTDFPLIPPDRWLEDFEAAGFKDSVKPLILKQNAIRLLKLDQKMKFDNSTFIVTGGASGLGEATVRRFHGAGANVVIADLNAERGAALAVELGARAVFQRCDVAAEADAQACVATALARFSGLQGLINCAGIGIAEKVLNKDGPQKLANFARVININLVGTFNMIRIASEAMSKGEPNPPASAA
jgi:hypothetical protein